MRGPSTGSPAQAVSDYFQTLIPGIRAVAAGQIEALGHTEQIAAHESGQEAESGERAR